MEKKITLTPISVKLIEDKGFQEIDHSEKVAEEDKQYDLSLFDLDQDLKWHLALWRIKDDIWHLSIQNQEKNAYDLENLQIGVKYWEDIRFFCTTFIGAEELDEDSQRDLSRLVTR